MWYHVCNMSLIGDALMGKFLVTYDLRVSGMDYSQLNWILKSFPYVKIADSVWVISSDGTAQSIRDKLRLFVDVNDLLFVCELAGDAAGLNLHSSMQQVNTLLKSYPAERRVFHSSICGFMKCQIQHVVCALLQYHNM